MTSQRGRLVIAGAGLSFLALLVALRSQIAASSPDSSAMQPAQVASGIAPNPPTRVAPAEVSKKPDLTPAKAGEMAYARGDFQGALAEFQRAVDRNPDDPDALNNLAQCLVRVGRAADAIPHFERAIALNPNSWSVRFNLAHAHGALNDWPKAVAGYRDAVKLFPDDYVTHYNLGLALHKNAQEEDAIPEFRKAIELAPGEATFHLSLGISYERLNKRAEAIQAYEDYVSMAPSAPDAAQVRSRIEELKKPS